MILKNWPEAGECCAECGKAFNGKHVCYWEGRRICTRCHDAAYEWAEWEREWREGERIPGAVVAVMLASGLLVFGFVVWVCG